MASTSAAQRTSKHVRATKTAGLELRNRLAALLAHLFEHAEQLGIIERDALIDFALLDRGQRQSDRGQPLSLAGPHRALHVLGDAFPERHGDAPA